VQAGMYTTRGVVKIVKKDVLKCSKLYLFDKDVLNCIEQGVFRSIDNLPFQRYLARYKDMPHHTGCRFLGCVAKVMSCNDVIWHDPKHDSLQRKGTLRCLWNRVKANIEAKEKINQQ
jgi:hypothetical protein